MVKALLDYGIDLIAVNFFQEDALLLIEQLAVADFDSLC